MTILRLNEPYQKRPIRFLELWKPEGWHIKVYGIAYQPPFPRNELVEAAKNVFRPHLSQTQGGYHIGFLGVHDGRGANFVFLDYWKNENELMHLVYSSPKDRINEFTFITPTGLIACTWDLALICHERNAWVECVLVNPSGPDFEAYLKRRMDADV